MTGTTVNETRIAAPPERVWQALVTPALVARWLPPPPMACRMYHWEAQPGGAIHYVLTYPPGNEEAAKTPQGDVCRGRFLAIDPPRRLEQIFSFDGDDPGLRGEMRVEIALLPAGDGTLLTATCRGIPPAIPEAANHEGWELSLGQLRALVEAEA